MRVDAVFRDGPAVSVVLGRSLRPGIRADFGRGHEGHGFFRNDPLPVVDAAVQKHLTEDHIVVSGRDHASGSPHEGDLGRIPGGPSRHPATLTVALVVYDRHPVELPVHLLRHFVVVAVAHAQRRVQLLVQVLVEGRARGDLHQRAQGVVAGVVVAVGGARDRRRPDGAETGGLQLERQRIRMLGARFHVGLQEEGRDAQPARVRQQVPDVDEPGPVVVPGRHVFAHQILVGQPPVLHQHRDGRGHRRFGVGGHAEHGVAFHGDAAGLVPPPQRLVQHDLPVLGDQEHRPHQVAALDGLVVERDSSSQHAFGHAGVRRSGTRDDGSLGRERCRARQGADEGRDQDETGIDERMRAFHGDGPPVVRTRYLRANVPIQ